MNPVTSPVSRRSNLLVTILSFVLFFIAIAGSYSTYYVRARFDYLIEASCDPETEMCFSRDCESMDAECPPNNLSLYKQWFIHASDFPKCADNSCKMECEQEVIECRPILCDAGAGDECKGIDPQQRP